LIQRLMTSVDESLHDCLVMTASKAHCSPRCDECGVTSLGLSTTGNEISAAQLCDDACVDDQQNFDTLTADVAGGVDAAGSKRVLPQLARLCAHDETAGSKREGSYRNWPEYALMMRDLEEAICRFWENLEAKAAALSLAAAQEALQRESALAAKHWEVQQVVNASEERLARLEEALLGENGETSPVAEHRTVPSFPDPHLQRLKQQQQQQQPHQPLTFAHKDLMDTQIAATVSSAFAEAAEVTVMAEAGVGLPLDMPAIAAAHAAHSCMGEHVAGLSKWRDGGSSDVAGLSSCSDVARFSTCSGELSPFGQSRIGRLLPNRALAKAPPDSLLTAASRQKSVDSHELANVLGKLHHVHHDKL